MKYFYLALLTAILCVACDPYSNPRYSALTFSSDTISFDTVFASIGTPTMEVRVKNKTGNPVLVDRIWLAGGSDSPFRININGYPDQATDVTIPSGDSIFIFIDLKSDPSGNDAPVYLSDSVMLSSGNYFSKVILEAWGQDIIIINSDITDNTIWGSGKPYLIYGEVMVDTLKRLDVAPGTRVYFHNDASLIIAGSLRATGDADDAILFASDRTQSEYVDYPGHWNGIAFRACSGDNILKDVVVRNAVIALDIEGNQEQGRPSVNLENTTLIHNSVSALRCAYSDLVAVNSLFADTGFGTVTVTDGSKAVFIFCTIVNNWRYNNRTSPALLIEKGEDGSTTLPEVNIYNTVITGDHTNEMSVDGASSELPGRIMVDSSFVTVEPASCQWWNSDCFIDVTTEGSPRFIDAREFDFRPDTLSPLNDVAGKSESHLYTEDIRHRSRRVFNAPDIGAYERQPGEKGE